MKALSLFSCIGVAEYYLRDLGIDVLVASDIDKRRCAVHRHLYPKTEVVCGDITKDETKQEIFSIIADQKIDLIISTPPCQGASSIGKNRSMDRLVNFTDERNSLICETFDFIDRYSPSYVIFENVPRILKAKVVYNGKITDALTILKEKYGTRYELKCNIYNANDFGVPQSRDRLFIRMYKKGLTWNDPVPYDNHPTLYDAIWHLPSLDPGEDSGIKNHWARKHPANQIEWMRHTPTGCSAVENQKFYPQKDDGSRIKSFPNCYKRMCWDKPSPTVTMRNEIMSSQDKVHPGRLLPNGLWSDPRVLTLRELLIIMSLPGDLDLPSWETDTAIRQFIGEGIPSRLLEAILKEISNA